MLQKKLSVVLTLSLLFLAGCKTVDPYPDELLTIIDVQNGVCRDYKLVDQKNITFEGPVARYALNSSKCQVVWGYRPEAFKKIQNWARDSIAKQGKVYHSPELEAQILTEDAL